MDKGLISRESHENNAGIAWESQREEGPAVPVAELKSNAEVLAGRLLSCGGLTILPLVLGLNQPWRRRFPTPVLPP